jgi:plasmid stabilization system protein ParE
MKNDFGILWSKESKVQFERILLYLKNKWTEKEIKVFISQLKSFEKIVVKFPEIYSESKEYRGIRRAVLSKHNSVIYAIDWENNIIRVYTIFDNRQHPDKLK